MLAQTTDSEVSNNTMAETMFDILADKNGTYSFDWRPKEMHIRCFCRKIALIVNAGLAELGIAAPPPPKVKESILGTFPYSNTMPTILEEDEEDTSCSPVNNYVYTNDKHDEEEVKAMMKEKKERKKTKGSNEDSEEEGKKFEEDFEDPTDFHASNELDRLTKKVCFQHSSF
jgi:hypothetical protein